MFFRAFFSFAYLLVMVKAQLPNSELPLRVSSVAVERDSPRSCPSAETLQSARISISREIRSSLQQNFPCGDGNWRQVINFNMELASNQCPSPWIEVATPQRSCTEASPSQGCEGVSFNVTGGPYSKVCGRAVGYGVNTPDGFAAIGDPGTIDTAYLDGVSITYGSPRQHIWSFAAGHGPINNSPYRCPCDSPNRSFAPLPPPFVGDNYFCDGDYNGALWDAMDCTTACCTFNSPPYFSVTLPTPTSDAIEARICTDQHGADEKTHISFLQIFVQ